MCKIEIGHLESPYKNRVYITAYALQPTAVKKGPLYASFYPYASTWHLKSVAKEVYIYHLQ